jgi:Pyruvate/2-oxoacid:ferredoxin oxidoreductase delta subunit
VGCGPSTCPPTGSRCTPACARRTCARCTGAASPPAAASRSGCSTAGATLRALWDLPQDLAVSPVGLAYYFIGRFGLAKTFVASRDCDACGACVKGCPVGALRLVDGRPFWTWRCESCVRCMNACPKRAIETAHGFLVGVMVLFSAAMAALVYPALHRLAPALMADELLPAAARNALEAGLSVGTLVLCYRLLHRALRWRVVERLVVATSLTHWRWWRRYRAPRWADGSSLETQGRGGDDA